MDVKPNLEFDNNNLKTQLRSFSLNVLSAVQEPSFSSLVKTFQHQLSDFMEATVIDKNQTTEIFTKFSNQFSGFAPRVFEFYRSINDSLILPLAKVNDNLQSLPKLTKDALITLGQHGWYFDIELPLSDLWNWNNEFINGGSLLAEKIIINYFREHLPQIEERLQVLHPERAKVIHTAFNAHNRGEFDLSIPVFLAQSDGICSEKIQKYLFIKKNNRPEIATYAEQIAADTVKSILLFPLSQTLPISASKKDRNKFFTELNRHQIMHGESLDYGTEKNSLKALSLLNYIAQVLNLEDSVF
jgi:hypothetical protein